MKRIIVVAESIDVEDSSGSKANVALIHSLKKANFEVEVFHYTRKTINLKNITSHEIKENRRTFLFFLSRAERFLRNNLNTDIHKSLEKTFGFSFTLFNDRNSIVSCLRKVNDDEVDLILTLSKGGSFRPHHALLRLPHLHSKWMAYFHDPYPMHLYPRPYAWVEPGYMAKWKFVKNVSLKAKYSAFPSKLLMEWMGSYFKNFLKSGIVLPHQISKLDSGINLPEHFEPDKFNVVHAGNLLHARDPKGLIEGFKLFISKHPEAESKVNLLFIGATNYFENYLSEKAKENSFINYIPENRPLEEVDAIQKEAAVNIILEAKSEISPFLPGKFPYCISSNKPLLLLGPYYSESRRLLGNDYPYWSEIDDIHKIESLINHMYLNWKMNPKNSLDREDLEYYLSEDNLKKTILNLLES